MNNVFPVFPASVRFSQLDSHWEISTGKQRGPASRKPSIRLLHLPSLRQHFPSPPWGPPVTAQVGSSHWLCLTLSYSLLTLWRRVRSSIFFVFLCVGLAADGMTHSMELNALCMKLGKKPMYKPVEPYPGMRPPNFNYNVRAPGPYQRSMQQ